MQFILNLDLCIYMYVYVINTGKFLTDKIKQKQTIYIHVNEIQVKFNLKYLFVSKR